MGFVNVEDHDVSKLIGYTSFLERDLCYENFCENSTDAHAMLLAFKDNPAAFQ